MKSPFSNEVLDLKDAKPGVALRTFFLTIGLVLAAEGGARVALSGNASIPYWERNAEIKFEAYHELQRANQVPDILLIGDSTAAGGLNPGFIPSSYNLAWPANFPKAFSCTTFPLLVEPNPVPKMVIVSLSPYGFRENPYTARKEQNLLSSPYCRALRGEFVLSEYLALARISHAIPGFLVQPPMTKQGFLPVSEKKVRAPAAAQPAAAPPAEPAPVYELSEERFAIMKELAGIAQKRRFRLVIVIPPRADHPQTIKYPLFQDYRTELAKLEQAGALTVLDLEDPTYLDKELFRDPGHLTEAGSELLSKEISKQLGL